MIVLACTLALMLLALTARFGRAGLARLAALRLRAGPLALLAVIAQLLGVRAPQYRFEALLLSALLLGIFCWLNRRVAGIALATLGIMLNLIVMAANGGAMPISPDTIFKMNGRPALPGAVVQQSKDIVIGDEQATFAWLGDRLLLPGSLAQISAWSVGDMLLLAGVGWLLWSTMKGAQHASDRFRHPAASS